ncbi:hypothetical protein QR680_010286 [Steinernema hermaphroditum]|uniref:ShKT domain-containing protein n=1 Tax=Steinernema hermaphroditum TaxID=289476 RepID=A0AA39MBI5_9BILA|nr:hypothetical protein QR680_010286 [Steinernema hermaphroditum]
MFRIFCRFVCTSSLKPPDVIPEVMLWQVVFVCALVAATVVSAEPDGGAQETGSGASSESPEATNSTGPPRCQDSSGNLLDSATSCEDEMATCSTVFKTAAVKSPGSRDPNCDVELLADIAQKCSKTCGICCENPNYSCGDAKGYEALCPQWKKSCGTTEPTLSETLSKYCAGTCGLCMKGSCRDALPECSSMGILCNDVTAGPVWKQQCARTCNTCTNGAPSPNAGPCGDTRPKCAQYKSSGFCTNEFYNQKDPTFIRRTCGKTCGLC